MKYIEREDRNGNLSVERVLEEGKYESITCPFCNETDFDFIGLKLHIVNGHCDKFNETPLKD